MKEIGFFKDIPEPTTNKLWNTVSRSFIARLQVIQRYASTLEQEYICFLCDYTPPQITYIFGGYTWPAAYKHLVEKHGVEPPPDFYMFILEQSVARKAPKPDLSEKSYVQNIKSTEEPIKNSRILVQCDDGVYPATVTVKRGNTTYFKFDDGSHGSSEDGDGMVLGLAKIKRQRKTPIDPENINEWLS